MSRRVEPAERVARAAARIIDALGADAVGQARETSKRVKGVGGTHFIANGKLVALADAVEEWRTANAPGVSEPLSGEDAERFVAHIEKPVMPEGHDKYLAAADETYAQTAAAAGKEPT